MRKPQPQMYTSQLIMPAPPTPYVCRVIERNTKMSYVAIANCHVLHHLANMLWTQKPRTTP